ncbi:glycosyltransferase family 4 protein [Priestia megaterium]|uniref:glycosyltransferase family 4 protein n=1 Tax=Priestia megaterium TaxID=1404 RepID=UPI0030095D15
MKKIKILFAGHDLKFAQLIMNSLNNKEQYEVRVDEWLGHNVHNEAQSVECLNWADVIVCEWGLGNAVWYSKHKKPYQRLIVRMHRQEVETNYPFEFEIDNIDQIIAISPYVYEEFYRTFRFPREKMTMIYNLVDTREMDQPKITEAQFNLGIIGVCPKMKRLDLAIDVLEKLWNRDSRYKLYVKGKLPQEYTWLWNREEERSYYEELFERIEQAPWKENVIFDGYGSDIGQWLSKIGFVLSTSDFESFHLAPSEGMASGAYPLILKWSGSDTIYPNNLLLADTDEIVEKVEKMNGSKRNRHIEVELKKYVMDNFSIQKITSEWESLISRLTVTI